MRIPCERRRRHMQRQPAPYLPARLCLSRQVTPGRALPEAEDMERGEKKKRLERRFFLAGLAETVSL